MTHPNFLYSEPDASFKLTSEQLGRRFEFLTTAFRPYLGFVAVWGARRWRDPVAETDPYFNFIDESLTAKRAKYNEDLPLSAEELAQLQDAHRAAYLGEDPEQGGPIRQQEFLQWQADLVAYTQEYLEVGDISSLVSPESAERMQQLEAMFTCLSEAGCSEQHAYLTVMTAIGARTRADMGADVGLTERGVRGAINYSMQKIKAVHGEDEPMLAFFKEAFASMRVIEREKRKKPPARAATKPKARRRVVKPAAESAPTHEAVEVQQLVEPFNKTVFIHELLGQQEASGLSESALLQLFQAGQAAQQQIEDIDSPPGRVEFTHLQGAMHKGQAALDRLVELHQEQVGLALRSQRETILDAGIDSWRSLTPDATEGLRRAIQHYAPGQEVALSDYVRPWINRAIQEALDRHESGLS